MSEPIWAPRGDDEAVADHVATRIAAGARRLALPGGDTPVPILAALRRRPLPWREIAVCPTDERIAPPGHRASNRGALEAALAGTGARVEPLEPGGAPTRFDLVWLGMGTDGHIASIFPSMPIGVDDPPGVVHAMPDPLPPEAPFARFTLNYAALADADEIILVVRGSAKRALLEAGRNDLPVARLMEAARRPVTIFWSET